MERRHYEETEWQDDPITFIKGLIGEAGDPSHAMLPAPPSGKIPAPFRQGKAFLFEQLYWFVLNYF